MGCAGSKVPRVIGSRVSLLTKRENGECVKEVNGVIDLATMNFFEEVLMTIEKLHLERSAKVWGTYQCRDGDVRRIWVRSNEEYQSGSEDVPAVETNISDTIPNRVTGKYTICMRTAAKIPGASHDLALNDDVTRRLIRIIARRVAENGYAANRGGPIFALLFRDMKAEDPELKILWRTKEWEKVIGFSEDFWMVLDLLDNGDTADFVTRVFDEGGMSLPMVRTSREDTGCIFSVQVSPLLKEANVDMLACQIHAILSPDREVICGKEEESDLFEEGLEGNSTNRETIFDSIRLGTLIGKGGYGSVYRAILDGKIVALKILDSVDKCVTTGSIDNQLPLTPSKIVGEQEVAVGRKLGHHKHVVETMEYATRTVEGREQAWIVLEFCESGSLRQLIEDRYFDSHVKVIRVAKEIAIGMAYLHAQGVLHGDLSSNNVLFDKEHVAKISDFGLSRDFGGVTVVTSALGTTCYMAPELLSSGKLNKAGDVYSYGILMLEMLTGKRAFSGMRYVEIITSKLANESGLCSVPSDAPEMLKELVIECTEMDYNRRPSFQEILDRFCRKDDIKTR